MKQFLLITFCLLVLEGMLHAQDFRVPRNRTERVNKGDTVYVFQILLEPSSRSCQDKLFYYWFADTCIRKNQGTWKGKLLDGLFQVFLREGKLIKEGLFHEGLKQGTWRDWDNDGKMIKSESWKDGVLHGMTWRVINDSIQLETKFRKGKIPKRDSIKNTAKL